MRKQIARAVVSLTVLPISFFITNMASPGHPGSSGSSDQLHKSAKTASAHALFSHRNTIALANYRLISSRKSKHFLTNPSTTWTTNLGVVLSAASSQVLTKGQAIEAQYQQQAQQRQAELRAQQASSQNRSYSQYQFQGSVSMQNALACIRQYESGDNYSDTSNPYYRGAYQFSWSSWESVGGTGDPASASPAEQDMRAELLAEKDGWSSWSTASLCGL